MDSVTSNPQTVKDVRYEVEKIKGLDLENII